MNIKKRYKYKEGAIVRIPLNSKKNAFGRLFPGNRIGVYNLFIDENESFPDWEILNNYDFIFFVRLSSYIITTGIFETMEFHTLTQRDIEMVPPSFRQDKLDINDCIISYPNDRLPQRKATPQECIGLEASSVWQEMHIVERIENFINKRKNPSVERDQVILTTDDIRYNPGPFLRWDFVKQEFYRVTEQQIIEDFKNGKMS